MLAESTPLVYRKDWGLQPLPELQPSWLQTQPTTNAKNGSASGRSSLTQFSMETNPATSIERWQSSQFLDLVDNLNMDALIADCSSNEGSKAYFSGEITLAPALLLSIIRRCQLPALVPPLRGAVAAAASHNRAPPSRVHGVR